MREAFRELGCAENRTFLQSREESFYYHTLYQRPELWIRKVGLFCFEGMEAAFSSLEISDGTRPAQVRVRRGERQTLPEDPGERDRQFVQMIERCLGTDRYSSLFLVGEGFDREWAKASFRFCAGTTAMYFMGIIFLPREPAMRLGRRWRREEV